MRKPSLYYYCTYSRCSVFLKSLTDFSFWPIPSGRGDRFQPPLEFLFSPTRVQLFFLQLASFRSPAGELHILFFTHVCGTCVAIKSPPPSIKTHLRRRFRLFLHGRLLLLSCSDQFTLPTPQLQYNALARKVSVVTMFIYSLEIGFFRTFLCLLVGPFLVHVVANPVLLPIPPSPSLSSPHTKPFSLSHHSEQNRLQTQPFKRSAVSTPPPPLRTSQTGKAAEPLFLLPLPLPLFLSVYPVGTFLFLLLFCAS